MSQKEMEEINLLLVSSRPSRALVHGTLRGKNVRNLRKIKEKGGRKEVYKPKKKCMGGLIPAGNMCQLKIQEDSAIPDDF